MRDSADTTAIETRIGNIGEEEIEGGVKREREKDREERRKMKRAEMEREARQGETDCRATAVHRVLASPRYFAYLRIRGLPKAIRRRCQTTKHPR